MVAGWHRHTHRSNNFFLYNIIIILHGSVYTRVANGRDILRGDLYERWDFLTTRGGG